MTKRRVVVEDICKIKYVSDPRFSACGKLLAYTLTEADVENNGYESSIYVVDEHKNTTRVTYSAKKKGNLVKDTSPRWSPDSKYLAFTSNRNGKKQIFVMPQSGEAHPVAEMGGSSITWSADSKKIAFVAKDPAEKQERKNPDKMHFTKLRYKFNGQGYFLDNRVSYLWIADVETGEVKKVTNTKFNDSMPTWSPCGKFLAFVSTRHEDETNLWSDIFVVNIESGDTTKITSNNGPASMPAWSPCGEYISFVGHSKGEKHSANQNIMVVPAKGGEAKNLSLNYDRSINAGPGSDARYGAGNNTPMWAKDGSGLYFRTGDQGLSKICFVNLKGEVTEIVTEKQGFTHFDVNECNGQVKIAFNAENPTHPGEVYVYANGNQSKMTGHNDALMAELELTYPENFTYKSAKDWDIEGWIMKPVGYKEGEKFPVVVQIHGGPASAYGWTFYHEFHLLCAMGYGIVYTNPRGSRTYGEDFTHGVIGDWGGHDYDDVMNAVEYVTANYEWVDSERIGVTGGSYGGYLCNWIATQTDRFKAIVSLRSISNIYTKYGVSDIGWYGNRRGMDGADLWDGQEKGIGEDFIMSRSAIRFADKATTPILLIHSEEDYRCPFEQAEQFYVALKRLGKAPVELLVFKRENHELSRSGRPWNRFDRLRGITDWFERYLK